MAVDYLSTLNKNGSGLNLTELAASLVQAQTAPYVNIAEERKSTAELSISAYGQLRSAYEEFGTALSLMAGATVLSASSDKTEINVEVSNTAKAIEATSYIEVASVAKRQVLEFTGFTSEDQLIGTGNLLIEFGVWTSDTSFTPNPNYEQNSIAIGTGATLSELASALSALDGVNAKVLDRGDGTFTLGIVSEEGAGRSLRMSLSNSSGEINKLDISASKEASEVQSASDAMLSVDGLTVFRSSNVIEDVIDGVKFTLNGTTDGIATVKISHDKELANDIISTFLNKINNTLNNVRSMTAYGTEANDAGDLAGDRYAIALMEKIKSVLKSPISGPTNNPIYLADLGVSTARNGDLYLNRTIFDANFSNDPSQFSAIFNDTFTSSDSKIEVFGEATSTTIAGTYNFSLDANSGSATLDDNLLAATPLIDGRIGFTATAGPVAGISIITEASTINADITYGRSLVATLQATLEEAFQVGGLFDNREKFYTSVISHQNAKLEELSSQAVMLETRFLKQFAAMESAITSMKNTSDYLTNMVESWNS